MTISFSTITNTIMQHLSIVGKRQHDKENTSQFSAITVSTAEKPIFVQYAKEAAQAVKARLLPLVSSFTTTATTITLTLDENRAPEGFDTQCEAMVSSFIVAYALNAYLGMNYPALAQKYGEEAALYMQDIVAFAYHRDAPTPSVYSYSDVTGEIINQQSNE